MNSVIQYGLNIEKGVGGDEIYVCNTLQIKVYKIFNFFRAVRLIKITINIGTGV